MSRRISTIDEALTQLSRTANLELKKQESEFAMQHAKLSTLGYSMGHFPIETTFEDHRIVFRQLVVLLPEEIRELSPEVARKGYLHKDCVVTFPLERNVSTAD